jgi:hypothetical protein
MNNQHPKLDLGINVGLSNAEYHAEKLHLSSSNLKLLLESPAEFYRQKIEGNKPAMSNQSALDLGSYVHTLILEPELAEKEFAVYTGWRKQGQEFEAFKAQHPGKIILSAPQQNTGERLAKSVQACPAGLKLLQGGMPELSLASTLLGVPVKMRADYIQPERRYILDVKTTRYPNESATFRRTVKQLGYELSAALYCEIAHQVYGYLFDFYWLVISKSDMSAVVYKASSDTLSQGSAMVTKALVTYKKCKEANLWPESLAELPNPVQDLEIEEI